MNISTMIFTPISGAVIGYFTNWLAIKMLFRPHNEIKLLGIKLPFTPGLIPKERYRLADKVSEAISQHLLTKEALAQSLTSDKVTEKIVEFIDKIYLNLSNDERTIGEYAGGSSRAGEIISSAEREASRYILNLLCDAENQKKAAGFITEKLAGDSAVKIPESFLITLKDYVSEKLIAWTLSEGFDELISGKANDLFERLLTEERSFREIFSADWLISFKSMIGGGAPAAAEFICKIPENNPALEAALKSALHKVMDENLGKLASLFINKDKVYENIKESLFEYLRNPENQADLALKITGAIEKAMDMPVCGIAGKIPESFKQQAAEKILHFLKYEMCGGFYEKIWESIETGLAKDKKIAPGLYKHIEDFIFEIINKWVMENGQSLAEKIPAFIKEKLFEIKVGDILLKLPEDKANALKATVAGIVKSLINKGAVYAAEAINVGQLTKDQINSMDLVQGEEIVLSVVKRELNAITYFGGVLGFIIGLLPVLFEFIMN